VPSSNSTNFSGGLKTLDIVAFFEGSGSVHGVIGADFDAEFYGSGAATQVIGARPFAYNQGTGTVAQLWGLEPDAGNYGSGVVAEAAAMSIDPDTSTGPVTNKYGLKIGDQAGATLTNAWAIKAGLGRIEFDALKTTGAAAGKKVVCVDTSSGILYTSSTGTDCSN